MSKYILKSKLKPDKKIDLNDYIPKTQIPIYKTCPDMNDYIKKTEIPTYPNMSDYIHKNDIPKQKTFFNHLIDIAKSFKKHFVKKCPDPIKVEHSPKPEKKSEPKPEPKPEPKSEPESKIDSGKDIHIVKFFKVEPKSKPKSEPKCEFKSTSEPKFGSESKPKSDPDCYGDSNHMSLFGKCDTLRPANSFTCNGYSPQRTDSCYYY